MKASKALLFSNMLSTEQSIEESGSIVSFEANEAGNADSVIVGIDPVQAGSGDPSPDNVRPISGWTGCQVQRTGKNLLKPNKYQASANVLTLGQNDNTSFGTFLKAGVYTISYKTVSSAKSIYYQKPNDSSGTRISTGTSGTFTLAEDSYCRFWLYLSTGVLESDISETMIELGSTATSYEPYSGTTYPISWQTEAGTVYGGTLDIVSGVMTVDKILISFLATGKQDNFMYTTLNQLQYPAIKGLNSGVICNRYPVKPNITGSETNAGITLYANGIIRWVEPDYIDKTYQEFNTMMGDNRVEAVYELATPLTYQLTPTEVSILKGMNNIWADTGDVSVKYLSAEQCDFLRTYLLMKGVNL